MAKKKKLLILNASQIQQKINRIAYQILEDNLYEAEIILAAIWDSGFSLAQRLETVLKEIAPFKVSLLKIELNKNSSRLEATSSASLSTCEQKVVVLVDDVLSSGKTLSYGMGVFINTPLKKLRTVVLINRSHKIYPIATDFVGLEIATVLKELVEVILDKDNQEDAVYLS